MKRLNTLYCLFAATLLAPSVSAQRPGTGTGLDGWQAPAPAPVAPPGPTAAEKDAAKKAAAQTAADNARKNAELEQAKESARQAKEEEKRAKAEALQTKKDNAELAAQLKKAKEDALKVPTSQPPVAAATADPCAQGGCSPAASPPTASPAHGTALPAYPGGPMLIALKSGLFQMGSDGGQYANEKPAHSVQVARFAMGQTELSFAQWYECVNDSANPLRCKHAPEDAWGKGDQPVMRVSYTDITTQYLPWLNDKARRSDPTVVTHPYRLPTEAEWEYAARAGGLGEFSLGPNNDDKIDSNKANYDANYTHAGSPKGEYRARTVPVKSFAANAFGLYNMHGNLWEWTADCYAENEYQRRKNAGAAWPALKTSPEVANCSRVVRGGSWDLNPVNLRSANRNHNAPGDHNLDVGFRLARTLF